jgi:hypothetical protein
MNTMNMMNKSKGKHTHKIHTSCPCWPDSPTQLNHKEETPRVEFLVRGWYAWDRIPSGEETKQVGRITHKSMQETQINGRIPHIEETPNKEG